MTDTLHSAKDLFGRKVFLKKGRANGERAEYIGYFFDKLAPSWKGKRELTHGYIAWRLTKLTLRDFAYIKSICEDTERRGGQFSKTFWGCLKKPDISS